jgi:hypothetical protein
MKRSELLQKAEGLINGDRAKDYGDAYDNHARIADGWNIILSGAMISHGFLTPSHVTLMMDWVKTSRLIETIDHEDSWIDKAGYTALGAEFIERDARPVNKIIEEINNGKPTNGNVRSKK